MSKTNFEDQYDLICVGGGIMSATLALMLKLIDKNQKILILERLDKVALESSAAWNNAGTGHSAFCEMNYTPKMADGSIDISKAIKVCTQFEKSKQFWSFLVKHGYIETPKDFIHPVPHHSWVEGKDNVNFLKKRVAELTKHPMFEGMQFSEDFKEMEKWFPLLMTDRKDTESLAATRMELGTEVNYGVLTRTYFEILEKNFDTPVHAMHEVKDVDPTEDEDWLVEIKNLETDDKFYVDAEHVFIGAGGGALPLLQKVEIEEKEGYGGFPVSGEWLICKNRDIIDKHHAKVYGKAEVGAPPMSMPHLDTRYIDGKQELLFGPFAGFSTKFLKEGSYLDLFKSIKLDNIPSMWGVFWHNIPLTKYLIEEVSMGHEDRMKALRKFVKNAKSEDWELKVAGQRVQIIKKDEEEGGSLEFGTEVVNSKDGRITALLGASPGASVAVDIMVELLHFAFPKKAKSDEWQEKLTEMIPFWNTEISQNLEAFKNTREDCSETLQINLPKHTN
ncbi:malate dehydrogenase (quinone) [Aequorivita marina]|uniref:malate dehydrogenase (quinone) n=1 Tax=Aequorivita marina TaxID=3073654 RepID=UPI0028740E88|nr:malate dehydrogenase (quinone) [Aequorivita sp. S2608]MDS1297869.1 malate dehydrogenase (quinone) [Aequorivita sp. S2608]